MKKNNLVSVLLPVRNGMPYLPESIGSILKQSFDRFEFVVVNDGSSDGTQTYLNSLIDSRIKVLKTEGVGLVNALNLGLKECSGKYLVRMDADDISELDRIEAQIKILEANEDIGVVCSDIIRIDKTGKAIGSERAKIQSMELLRDGLLGKASIKPIVHPTVMARTSLLNEIGGYRQYHAAEDRDLWLRLVDRCLFHRIQRPLLKYRVTSSGVSRMQREKQATSAMLAVLNYQVHGIIGIDLYQTYPALLDDIRRICADFNNGQASAVAEFEALKSSVRNKNIIEVFGFIASLGTGNSLKVFPSIRRRAERCFMERLILLSVELLESIKDMPDKTLDCVFKKTELSAKFGAL